MAAGAFKLAPGVSGGVTPVKAGVTWLRSPGPLSGGGALPDRWANRCRGADIQKLNQKPWKVL